MEILKDYLEKKGIFPRVNFDDKELHTFKILKGKKVVYPDGTSSFKMLVKEGNEFRILTTPTVLVEIRDCQPGDVYEVQLKYRGRFRDYQVKKISSAKPDEVKEETPDIGEGEEKLVKCENCGEMVEEVNEYKGKMICAECFSKTEDE